MVTDLQACRAVCLCVLDSVPLNGVLQVVGHVLLGIHHICRVMYNNIWARYKG